ncbi:MAG: protein kinase [Polyangiaceae bacterium]
MTSRQPLGPGVVIQERYRIESLLGEGGYGAVYVATQLGLGRKVALKILHAEVLARPTARQRFEREAMLAQRLTHPNIVRLFDFGTAADGSPFIVWELLAGRSVEQDLATRGPMPPARVSHLTQQVLKGLAEAHGVGIVHRDIKPANIFLSDFTGEPDFVKVLDFGIAAGPRGDGNTGITQEGISLGTPAYMAPEQVLDQELDGRADLYALGLMMAEMLTAAPVFRGNTALEIALRQIEDIPVPLVGAVRHGPLGHIIARATEKDPTRRFGSALEMLAALRAASTGANTGPVAYAPQSQPLQSHPSQSQPLGSQPFQTTPGARLPSGPYNTAGSGAHSYSNVSYPVADQGIASTAIAHPPSGFGGGGYRPPTSQLGAYGGRIEPPSALATSLPPNAASAAPNGWTGAVPTNVSAQGAPAPALGSMEAHYVPPPSPPTKRGAPLGLVAGLIAIGVVAGSAGAWVAFRPPAASSQSSSDKTEKSSSPSPTSSSPTAMEAPPPKQKKPNEDPDEFDKQFEKMELEAINQALGAGGRQPVACLPVPEELVTFQVSGTNLETAIRRLKAVDVHCTTNMINGPQRGTLSFTGAKGTITVFYGNGPQVMVFAGDPNVAVETDEKNNNTIIVDAGLNKKQAAKELMAVILDKKKP